MSNPVYNSYGENSAPSTNQPSLVVNVPSVADGDLMLMVNWQADFLNVPGGDPPPDIATPAGWALVDRIACGNSATYGACDFVVFARVASSEPSSYTLTDVHGNQPYGWCGAIITYTNANAVIDSSATTYTATTPFACEALTATGADQTLVVFWNGMAGDAANCHLGGPDTAGWTRRGGGVLAYSTALGLADKDLSSSGATPADTAFAVNNYGFTSPMGLITVLIGTAVSPDPTISGLTPPSGPIGQSVVIAGTNLDTVTAVDFNGTPAASFSDDSSIQITAVVDTGTTTGPVVVTNPDGSSTDDPTFTVTVPPDPPTVTSLSPDHGRAGDEITFAGTNLTGATAVDFNGTPAASFVVDSDIQLRAVVATTTGPVHVTTPGGTATGPVFTIDPPPATLPYRSPAWRFVVLDLVTFETLSFLDHLASGRVVTYTLDAPTQAEMVVPSDNPEINIPWPDPNSDPFLTEGSRVLYGFRRDGEEPEPWTPRFAGIIMQLEDAAQSDQAYSHLTAFDPWEYLKMRPVCNIDGSLPGINGISFTATTVDQIVGELLRNTIENQGPVGIDMGDLYGGTTFYDGTIETCETVSINFPQGTMLGDAWTQLTNQNDCDIVLDPIYDPVNRPGYLVQANVYNQVGSPKDDAIFAWDMPSRSLVQISRLTDGTLRANVVKFFSGIGGSASGGSVIPAQIDIYSVDKFGEYWRQQFFPAQNIANIVKLLAQAELALSKDGRTTVTISPAPERSPHPFDDYFVGDLVPVYASQRLRAPLAGYQRVYGIPLNIADDATESVQQLLTTEPS